MAKWLLLRENGSVAAQICTRGGKTPTEDGSNPDGLREVQVNRHADDLEAERFDEKTRRWKRDETHAATRRDSDAKAWLGRLPEGAMDLLVDAVAARLSDREGPKK